MKFASPASRRAERRLEEIELFRLLTAVEDKPRDAIIEALYDAGARVDELVQLWRRQLVDIDGSGGYVTLYGKHGGRTICVGPRTWNALQFLADGKEPDERIIAITDERIRQILTAATEAAGLKKKVSPHWLRHAHGSPAHQRGAPAATIRDTLGHTSLSTTDPLPQFGADGRVESVFALLIGQTTPWINRGPKAALFLRQKAH